MFSSTFPIFPPFSPVSLLLYLLFYFPSFFHSFPHGKYFHIQPPRGGIIWKMLSAFAAIWIPYGKKFYSTLVTYIRQLVPRKNYLLQWMGRIVFFCRIPDNLASSCQIPDIRYPAKHYRIFCRLSTEIFFQFFYIKAEHKLVIYMNVFF